MKKLIYLSNYIKRDFMGMIDLLVDSLATSGTDMTDIDVLVFTQEDFVEETNAIFKKHKIEVKIHSLQFVYSDVEVDDEERRKRIEVLDAAQMRMRLFEWGGIDDYDRILYIDTDVLIDGDLAPVFDAVSENKLYGLEEGRMSNTDNHFGRYFLPHNRREWPIPYTTPGFSSGVLLFNNCLEVRELFLKSLAHIRKYIEHGHAVPSCLEQPFLVYNAVIDEVYDRTKLIGLVVNNPKPWNGDVGHAISHFPRPIGNPGRKSRRMKRYLLDKRRSTE